MLLLHATTDIQWRRFTKQEGEKYVLLLHYAKHLAYLYTMKERINMTNDKKNIKYKDGIYILDEESQNKIEKFHANFKSKYRGEEEANEIDFLLRIKKEIGYNYEDIRILAERLKRKKTKLSKQEFLTELKKVGLDVKGEKNFLEAFILKPNDKEIGSDLDGKENKLRVRPIVDFNNYYFINDLQLLTSIKYFKERILHGSEIEFQKASSKMKIKERVHENSIDKFVEIANKKGIKNRKNLHLDDIPSFQQLLVNKKKIKREIDFYYLENDILYIIEYKHLSEEFNYSFHLKTLKNISRDQRKFLNMVNMIKKNETDFLNYLGIRNVKEIMPITVHYNLTTIENLQENLPIQIISEKDFIKKLKG